jgi:putative hemolysin
VKRLWLATASMGLLLVVACGARPAPAPVPAGPYILPNAASEYCLAEGYQFEVLAQEGDTTGYCIFPDDTRCELWAFYEGQCTPTPAPA